MVDRYTLIQSGDPDDAENVDTMFGHPVLTDYVHPEYRFMLTGVPSGSNATEGTEAKLVGDNKIEISDGIAYIGVDTMATSDGTERRANMVKVEHPGDTLTLANPDGENYIFIDAQIEATNSPEFVVTSIRNQPSDASLPIAKVTANDEDDDGYAELVTVDKYYNNAGPEAALGEESVLGYNSKAVSRFGVVSDDSDSVGSSGLTMNADGGGGEIVDSEYNNTLIAGSVVGADVEIGKNCSGDIKVGENASNRISLYKDVQDNSGFLIYDQSEGHVPRRSIDVERELREVDVSNGNDILVSARDEHIVAYPGGTNLVSLPVAEDTSGQELTVTFAGNSTDGDITFPSGDFVANSPADLTTQGETVTIVSTPQADTWFIKSRYTP